MAIKRFSKNCKALFFLSEINIYCVSNTKGTALFFVNVKLLQCKIIGVASDGELVRSSSVTE